MGPRTRTVLFVPGDRPERITNAVRCASDAIVVDLEDAVAEAGKPDARVLATQTIGGLQMHGRLLVRVNALDSPWFDDDVSALAQVLDRLWAVVLPKAEAGDDVVRLQERLDAIERTATGTPTRIVPVIETATGVLAAREIAAASTRVETLLFGVADLSTQLQVEPSADGEELLYARSHVVLATAAAARSRPLDGPYLRLEDDAGLHRSARLARRLGFAGKAVIHPAQLETVAAAFSPDEREVRWAKAVDDAFTRAERAGQGSIRLDDGTFVDYPVARRARSILAEAGNGGQAS